MLVLKKRLIVWLGLGLVASVIASCGVGELSDAAGGSRLGPGDTEPGEPAPSSPGGLPVNEAGDPISPISGLPLEDSACPTVAPDVSVADAWRSTQATQVAFDTLEFEVMARPGAADLDGLLAIGGEDISGFSDAAILVRFASDGLVDARDGSTYDKDVSYPYEAGVWYDIGIYADLSTKTYDVEIGRCGEPRQTLITAASFRSDASVSDQLSTWGAFTSKSATIEVSTPSWVAAGSCAPASCQSLGHVCGQASDGCGGNLSCGSCASGETCVSGTCIDTSSPPPTPPTLPYIPEGDFPTTETSGIMDYWCPRWDSLKTTSGSATYTVSSDDVVEYVHLTDGGFDLTGSRQTIRCSRATSDSQKKFEMTGGYLYGALMENVHAEAVITSSGGRSWYGGGSSFTVSRSQSFPTYADVMQTESGFWIDNYLDARVNAAGPTNIHTDGVQVSGGCGPHWYVHNTLVGDSGRNGIPEPSPRDCNDLSYWGIQQPGSGYCSNAVLFVKGKWSNQACRRIQSMVIADNYIDGGLYPSRWSDSSGRIINSAYWNNTWSPLWYYGPCWHKWTGSGNDGTYARVTDPNPSPNSSEICVEDDEQNNIDGDIGEADAECNFAPGKSFAKNSCSGGTNTTGIQPIPIMTMSTPSVSATSCTRGQVGCNDIDITVGSATTNEGPRARASGASDPDSGALWDTSAPGPSFRWRYSCGGSASNTRANPCASAGRCSGYEDGGADLWYRYPGCDGLSSCTMTNVCDFQDEPAGQYVMKVYVEAGPGAAYRPSTHREVTFTVN